MWVRVPSFQLWRLWPSWLGSRLWLCGSNSYVGSIPTGLPEIKYAAVAQMVMHLLCNQGIKGSSPFCGLWAVRLEVNRAVLSRETPVRFGYRLLCSHTLMDRRQGYELCSWRSSRHGSTVKCLCSSNRQSVYLISRGLQVQILSQAL